MPNPKLSLRNRLRSTERQLDRHRNEGSQSLLTEILANQRVIMLYLLAQKRNAQ